MKELEFKSSTKDRTKSPATSRRKTSRAKREQIVQAARKLFLAQGYARTSMDAVTQQAGVSKQTLYVYFPGKAELLAAIIAQELEALDMFEGARRLETPAAFRAQLLTFAGTLTGQLMQGEALALLRLLLGEAFHIPELRGLVRQTFPARLLATAEALICKAHDQGFISAPQPELSARLFVGPVMSFVMLDGFFSPALPTPPSAETLEQLVDAFLLTVSFAVAKGD